MKFFEGDLKNAISRRKTFSSAFIVFVESKDDESSRFRQMLDEENTIPTKEYIAFKISPCSEAYNHFKAIYREVPIPSVFIIGIDGQPICILTSCISRDDFYAEIKAALERHKCISQAQRNCERLKNGNSVQILLKLPKGETPVVEFIENTPLIEVKTFVKESLQIKEPFQMITPFPRKIFSKEDEARTLVELNLHPTSTILIVPIDKRKSWMPHLVTHIIGPFLVSLGHIARTLKNWVFNLIFRQRD